VANEIALLKVPDNSRILPPINHTRQPPSLRIASEMKTLGLIGGLTWEATAVYYDVINRRVRKHLGGMHSARCIIYSFDLDDIVKLQHSGDWDEAGKLITSAASVLKNAQVDAILICTNTMHKFVNAVEMTSGLPVLHIADATAERIKSSKIRRIGLLGTQFTMEEDFYKSRLTEKYELQVIIPQENERKVVHRIIYDELCQGIISPTSRSAFVEIIESLEEAGAEGVILGCTEIGLLVRPEDVRLPLFDTTIIHAEASADWAISASGITIT